MVSTATASARFVEQRKEEGPRAFAALYLELEPRVAGLLAATRDLRGLDGDVFRGDPSAWRELRYFCAPPVSEEDLWTLVGGPKFKRVPPAYADDVAEVIGLVLDPIRFPWVEQRRDPTAQERDKAVMATTALLTTALLSTQRRRAESFKQEAAVAEALTAAGYRQDPARTPVWVIDELERGTFSRERNVGGAKCDVPVRLYDGRLLLVECKISNGPKNSWKRLIREVGGKAEKWRGRFGDQVLTGAVLAGVYDLSCLNNSQQDGVVLFWQHDLQPLAEFVEAAR